MLAKLGDSRESPNLIAPFWTRQPWCPMLVQLLVENQFKSNFLSQLRQKPLSGDQTSSIFCLATLRRNLQAKGLSKEAVGVAAHARRDSTLHIYDSRVSKFRDWAVDRDVNSVEAPLDQLAKFLMSLFRVGKQVRTIRNYKSAIAPVHLVFPTDPPLAPTPRLANY